jgi:hypothetical protein
MLNLDRLLSALLILGAVGHTFGVTEFYRGQPDALFWSLCAGLLMLLVAAINLLRTWRPGDRAIAWMSAAASASYLVVTFGFGRLIGNMADPRVIGFGLISVGLLFFSASGALRPATKA